MTLPAFEAAPQKHLPRSATTQKSAPQQLRTLRSRHRSEELSPERQRHERGEPAEQGHVEQRRHDEEGMHKHNPDDVEVDAQGCLAQRSEALAAVFPAALMEPPREAPRAVEDVQEVLLLRPPVVQPFCQGLGVIDGQLRNGKTPIVHVDNTLLPETTRDDEQVQGLAYVRVADSDVHHPLEWFLSLVSLGEVLCRE